MQLETRFGKKGESVCTSLFESKLLEMKLANGILMCNTIKL